MTETRLDNAALAVEEMPSFADVAQEIGGGWPVGWYSGEILPGFTTGRGKVMETSDSLSKNGDSRNLLLCLKLTALASFSKDGNSVEKGATRNYFFQTNYRLEDLTAANVQRMKDKDPSIDTRLSISLSKLGMIEKAVGFGFRRHPQGQILAAPLVGQRVDVHLGFNKKDERIEVNGFAPFGTKAK